MHGLLQLVFVGNKVNNVYILFLYPDTILNALIICNNVPIIQKTLTTMPAKLRSHSDKLFQIYTFMKNAKKFP